MDQKRVNAMDKKHERQRVFQGNLPVTGMVYSSLKRTASPEPHNKRTHRSPCALPRTFAQNGVETVYATYTIPRKMASHRDF